MSRSIAAAGAGPNGVLPGPAPARRLRQGRTITKELVLAPELRRDPVTGRSVFVASGRAGRPRTVAALLHHDHVGVAGAPEHDPTCPFCPGNEHDTRGELVRTGSGVADGPGWRVRAFPNRYPVVDADGGPGATGACEVVVFSPRHDLALEHLPTWHLSEVFGVLQARVAAHRAAGRISPQVFVNHGPGSGASIAHPHAQIISLDFIPPAVEVELDAAAALGRDPLSHDLRLADEHGLVVLDGELAAWTPWSTREPYVVRIAPRVPDGPFASVPADMIAALADTFRRALRALTDVHAGASYNVVLHVDTEQAGLTRRWRVELVPRMLSEGGFERGSGMGTNAFDPRDEAVVLRTALSGQDTTQSGVACPEQIEEAGQ
jgi:UDPglucose--hexose-1-phosphate uridylyltransferase